MRIEKAAVMLNRSTKTVRDYINRGTLRTQKVGREVHVNERDVKRLQEALETINPVQDK